VVTLSRYDTEASYFPLVSILHSYVFIDRVLIKYVHFKRGKYKQNGVILIDNGLFQA